MSNSKGGLQVALGSRVSSQGAATPNSSGLRGQKSCTNCGGTIALKLCGTAVVKCSDNCKRLQKAVGALR